MAAKLSNSERDQAARVVALFSVLIHAWQTNNFHEASRTQEELSKLGVEVRIPKIRRPTRKGGNDAK